MADPELDPLKMNRLAFVRLLHFQAEEEAQRPMPLAATSVLTFHDAVEQFLILAAEHRKAGAPSRGSGIEQYWTLLKSRRGYAGVQLSGLHGISRLTSVRNDLKHLGKLPSAEDIADAKSAVSGFMEDNTLKAFGIEFAEIDMADVVPQKDTRAHLKAATAAEVSGDRKEAMAQLAEAFRDLFESQVKHSWGAVGFGPTIQRQTWGYAQPIVNGLNGGARAPQNLRATQHAAAQLDRQLKDLTEAVRLMQSGMRVIALGLDHAHYSRFKRLTPDVYFSGEERQVRASADYTPTRGEFDECTQFVIDAALRVAQVEAYALPPSWRSA